MLGASPSMVDEIGYTMIQKIEIYINAKVPEHLVDKIANLIENADLGELEAISRIPFPEWQEPVLESDDIPCECPYDCSFCHAECCD